MPYIENESTPQHYGHVNDGTLQTAGGDMYKCPSCGVYAKKFCMIDVKLIPNNITTEDWLCDGCWNELVRPNGKRQATHGGKPFTKRKWLELHGAPASALERQDSRDDRKLSKLESSGLSDEQIEKHMDIVHIRGRRP